MRVYFGVELNFLGCDQGFTFSREIKEEYGFGFAIGGIHSTYLEQYDSAKLVDIHHRYHLAVCRDPLVDVLVHPYRFLSALASEGVTFSVGSDAHDISQLEAIQDCWRMVERLGLTPDRIWKPKGEPMIAGQEKVL